MSLSYLVGDVLEFDCGPGNAVSVARCALVERARKTRPNELRVRAMGRRRKRRKRRRRRRRRNRDDDDEGQEEDDESDDDEDE